jgi:hypothetical protein
MVMEAGGLDDGWRPELPGWQACGGLA